MVKKLSIRNKLMLFIISASVIIYGSVVSYLLVSYSERAKVDAKNYIDENIRERARFIESDIKADMEVARTVGAAFSSLYDLPKETRISSMSKMLEKIAIKNTDYLAVWVSWELAVVDETYEKDFGRRRVTFTRINNELEFIDEIIETEVERTSGTYYNSKINKKEIFDEPYPGVYTGRADTFLMTSACEPILVEGEFVGLAGADLELQHYVELVNKIKPFNNAHAFLLSNGGVYVSHPNKTYIGKSFVSVNKEKEQEFDVTNNIKKGIEFEIYDYDEELGDLYIKFVPIQVGSTDKPWSLGIMVPMNVVMGDAHALRNNSIIVGLVGIILLALLIGFISKSIGDNIKQGVGYTEQISQGNLNAKMSVRSNDEVGQLAAHMNNMSLKLKGIVQKIKSSTYLHCLLSI